MRRKRRSFPPIFERYAVDANGCWIWPILGDDGYGRIREAGRTWRAHRYFYHHLIGPIPEGMTLDHLCFVPACVNPDHVQLATLAENAGRQRCSYKEVCANGHPYTPENTYRMPNGRRDCRACIRERVRRYQARKRAA